MVVLANIRNDSRAVGINIFDVEVITRVIVPEPSYHKQRHDDRDGNSGSFSAACSLAG